MKPELVGGLELPDGFHLGRGLFGKHDLDTVIAAVEWEQKTIRMFGRELDVPRLTAWYGTEAYTYSGIRHEPRAMPPVVAGIHGQLTGRGTFSSTRTRPASTRYSAAATRSRGTPTTSPSWGRSPRSRASRSAPRASSRSSARRTASAGTSCSATGTSS